jgi:manganese transport protein
VSNLLDLALGIMAALGGFVDIGELVFTVQGGAKFGYHLLWVVVVGSVGIIIYAEMSGRIAAVLKKPTFELIRENMSHGAGASVLVASNIVNLLTCAAEIGGIALVLQMLFGGEYRLMLVAAAGLLFIAIFFLEFRWLERFFGLLGLFLLVYAWVAVSLQPDWGEAAKGLVPRPPADDSPGWLVYAYFIVGLFSSILMPYEIYFYSSGGIEEKWTVKDLPFNLVNSALGFTLGALLAMALVIVGAVAFLPHGIDPHFPGTTSIPAAETLGVKGLLLALLGMLFAIGGAAVETALAGAYNLAQFYGWPWGKSKRPSKVRKFTFAWIGMLAAGLAIALSGIDPIKIVEFSVIFAVVVLPFTYYPILRVADDGKLMGAHANRPAVKVLAWIYFGLIVAAALSAVPLMYLTHMGEG